MNAERVLRAALKLLPEGRRELGAALLAEAAQLARDIKRQICSVLAGYVRNGRAWIAEADRRPQGDAGPLDIRAPGG